MVPGSRVCLVDPTVLVVRPTFSVASDHSPSDEQPDSTEAAGQAATARLALGQMWASQRCAHVTRSMKYIVLKHFFKYT